MNLEKVEETKAPEQMSSERMYALQDTCRRIGVIGDSIILGSLYKEEFLEEHGIDIGNMIKDYAAGLNDAIEDLFHLCRVF